MTRKRPSFIRNWRDLESRMPMRAPVLGEAFGHLADLAAPTGLSRLRVGHLRLPPGRRSNPPIAARDEEEFFFVLEGTPDLWIDGNLHRLQEGDGVAFNDRTGIAHAFLNNTHDDVRLFVTGEATRYGSRFFHPCEPRANAELERMGKLWRDPPARRLGRHDGLPDARRTGKAVPRAPARRPAFIANWRDILEDKAGRYPGSEEEHGLDALFGRRARFARIGIHFEVLKPGRRTSWPHAERDEEEYVYVVSGSVDAWIDGHLHPMRAGDFIGFEDRTGITHTIINNSGSDAHLLVGGEASRARNQFFYPFHAARNREVGALYWADHPKRRLGSHDGLPDALRKAARPRRRR